MQCLELDDEGKYYFGHRDIKNKRKRMLKVLVCLAWKTITELISDMIVGIIFYSN